MTSPWVSIVMGSDSDAPIMKEAAGILAEFGVPHEMRVLSAHRSPTRTAAYAKSLAKRGVRIVIAGAGHAAHLAGVIASRTTLPVLGVPIDSSSLKGLDALLSTVQMPGGVPVAAMALGKAGAKNAGLLAVAILALTDPALQAKLTRYRRRLEAAVVRKDRKWVRAL